MGKLIFGLILMVAGIIVMRTKKTTGKAEATLSIVMTILFLAGIISIGASFVRTVPTGSTGIVTNFGKVENYTYEAGIHMTAPWKKVICMDNRTQKESIAMSCFSSDIQEVTLTYTINYQIDKQNAQEIYRTIGTDYFNVVVYPKTLEAVKAVFAKYNAESLVESRGTLSKQIEETLVATLSEYNIEVVATSLEDIDFTDSFTEAVEAKQVAEQNKLKAQTEAEQAVIEAQAEADKLVIAAQADADAALIAAQNDVEVQKLAADAAEYAGQKQAAVNERIAESLTDDLNQYYLIEAWKSGADMPETVLGGSNLTSMISLK